MALVLKPVVCKTLLGHKDLDFSIECLQSFLSNSSTEIHLQIFEDGSLTPADEQKLLAELHQSTIVKKVDRDVKMETMLADYPACAAYRKQSIYAHKIFDVMLLDNVDVFYIDSDVYFLQKFSLPVMDEMPLFMFDNQNAYSFTPVDLLKINIPIFPNVNSGLFFFPQNLFSLAFIEQLLTDPIINKGVKKGIPWLEQTIWSFMAAKSRSVAYFDCTQVIMADFVYDIKPETLAVHLVYYFRTYIKRLRLLQSDEARTAAIKLKIGSTYLRKRDFAVEKLVRKMKRLV